ncbi:MAG TPA: M1 family metallopeptidase [Gemmatimonadaceae bacterium]|nr:M1 family metallopeptidase [Gemmatimonadaceae bacterium]
MIAVLPLLLVLQQTPQSATTPPSGDTTGYWQQQVHYTVAARLDEDQGVLHANGDLVYVNHSPDTLREMYVHQYLNAFRPGSQWSAVDEREGRDRFQHLKDPDFGYERFTAPVTVDGRAVRVEYPGAPDSTVARFALPRPLRPGDSIRVHFVWDARLSTVPRRQGRQGRHYDFAQWYPRVAVYDRGGWEYNALVPAGEFYGEFGTFDVTLVVRDDQVLGATAVVVDGDPGWQRVLKWGQIAGRHDDYGTPPAGPRITVPAGYKRVRFLAKRVHNFAWSASPDYMYEGGLYDGRVAIHVLYRPGDEGEWGNGQVVKREENALRFLESVFGPYPYPQVTNLHRIEGGGTEFPMMVMNGSGGQGLIYHETAHIYAHGALANNEWRNAWMDEGFASFLADWAAGATQPEMVDAARAELQSRSQGAVLDDAPPVSGARLFQYALVMQNRAQPIGLPARDFSDFATYNQMTYGRGEMLFSALRDAIGDSAFRDFLHLYYARWKYKHVDVHAMRAAAEAASGKPLGWFFDEWVNGLGLVDYALTDVQIRQDGNAWVTRARVVRRGEYRHPPTVGVRTSTAWKVQQGDPMRDDQWVALRTNEKPTQVRLDPFLTNEDYDRRNDLQPANGEGGARP